MESERLRVLKMVEAGLISAEEGAKLLDALQAGPSPRPSASGPRMLRVRVTELATGRVQANVQLPLAIAQTLSRAGSRVGMFWAPQLGDLDLPAIIDTIDAGEPGRVVEWSEGDGGRRFEVFIE